MRASRPIHLISFVIVCLTLTASAATPKDAVARGQQALAAKHYEAAAEAMEEAYRLDPRPLYAANAGYARMLAGQLDRAIELLSKALADAKLHDDARQRAIERLAKASSCRALLARADEARIAGDHRAVARAFDEASGFVPIGPFYLSAGEAYERAGEIATAAERYRAALAQEDLNEGQRRAATDGIARATATKVVEVPAIAPTPIDPPVAKTLVREPSSPTAGWSLIIGGGLSVAFGIGAFVELDADNRAFAAHGDAASAADDRALQSDARLWWGLGVGASALGVAAVTIGTVLVATHEPDVEGEVHVSGAPIQGGGIVTLGGSF